MHSLFLSSSQFMYFRCKQKTARAREINEWHKEGGVLILGYEMFRNLVKQTDGCDLLTDEKAIREHLINGPDLIVCDEAHLLRKNTTNLSIALSGVNRL